MAKYLVSCPSLNPTVASKRLLIVDAASAANARVLANALASSDGSWVAGAATCTDLSVAAATDLEGFVYRLRVGSDPATPALGDSYDVAYTCVGADLFDDAGDGLAALLVAEGLTATYATPVLTVAAIADGIGDHKISLEVTPYGCEGPVAFAVGAIVHGGIAGAVLTVTLDALATIPAIQTVI